MKKVDTWFLLIVLLLAGGGFLIFLSASFGLLAREEGAQVSRVVLNQVVFGLGLGLTLMFFISRINYKFWNKYAFYIFLLSIITTVLVFIPAFGLTLKGATRWLSLGPL